jgi:hypothetical protein
MVNRILLMETRAGVPHYVPGQLEASIGAIDEEYGGGRYAAISYVDQMGHVCEITLIEEDGQWIPMMRVRSGVRTQGNWEAVPDDFELSDKMLEALERAESEQ